MRSSGGGAARAHTHTQRAVVSVVRRNEETNADMNDGTEATVPKPAATAPVWEYFGFKQNEQGVSS